MADPTYHENYSNEYEETHTTRFRVFQQIFCCICCGVYSRRVIHLFVGFLCIAAIVASFWLPVNRFEIKTVVACVCAMVALLYMCAALYETFVIRKLRAEEERERAEAEQQANRRAGPVFVVLDPNTQIVTPQLSTRQQNRMKYQRF